MKRRTFVASLMTGGAIGAALGYKARDFSVSRHIDDIARESESGVIGVPRKTVVFAGHVENYPYRNNGPGAPSASGIPEYVFNDDLVQHFRGINPSMDYMVIPATQNVPYQERAQIAKKLGSEVYIEVHHDSAQEEDINRLRAEAKTPDDWRELSGFSVFYWSGDPQKPETIELGKESLSLAKLIGEEMVKLGFKPNHYHAKPIKGEDKKLVDPERGVYDNDFTVLTTNLIPAVMVEAGVVVNPFEEHVLRMPHTQKAIAQAIDLAVNRYFTERGHTWS